MTRRLALVCLTLAVSAPAARDLAILHYLDDPNAQAILQDSSRRTRRDLQELMPHRAPDRFIDYYAEKIGRENFAGFLRALDGVRMDKIIGSAAGGSGTTSLVSRAAAPAILGLGIEFGGIQQQSNQAVTSLRGNLLGVARMFAPSGQFPYCPAMQESGCKSHTRWMRRFSAAASLESRKPGPLPSNVPVADLFGNEYRMASWGVRFDLTGRSNLDDPEYQRQWRIAMDMNRQNPLTTALAASIVKIFHKSLDGFYGMWMAATLTDLQAASTPAQISAILEARLDLLLRELPGVDPEFARNMVAARNLYGNYLEVRDNVLRQLQSHKFSLEYTNQHPTAQLSYSNARLIYSIQPAGSTNLLTCNAAVSLYHRPPIGASTHIREAQAGVQFDHRLAAISGLGSAVLTFAGSYQYLAAAHIAIAQAKLTVPVGAILRVPISMTWSNRTEFVNEQDVRGQVGMTFDLDSLFR